MTGKLNIVIIGGGPTGLMTGILLSRAGIKSIIVEKSNWPIDKVCGEGIMPLGVSLLRKYDLLKYIDPKWSREFIGIKYIDKSGKTAEGKFQREPGLVVRRTALSEGLHAAAQKEQHLTLLPLHKLHEIKEKSEGIDIVVMNTESKELLTLSGFTYLLGADGLKSKVRVLNKMEGSIPIKQKNRMGARAHYEIPPWDNKVQVWWQDGIECYVAPTSNGCVEFNFGWDHDMLQPQNDGDERGLEAGLFHYFPELKEKIKGAKQLSPMRSWGPLPHRAKSPLIGRVALIGDSGIFYDHITGEGLSLAFVQAELVANTISTWHTQQGRDFFISTLNDVGDKYIQVTGFAMFFTRHPKLRKLMVMFLNRSPKLFSHLLHVNMGDYSLLKPPLRLLFQAIFFPQKVRSYLRNASLMRLFPR